MNAASTDKAPTRPHRRLTKKSLCEQLHAIDRQIKHPRGPTGDSLGRALTFLQKRKPDLYDAFADCAWTYATSPREPQPSFAAAFSRVHDALDHALTLFDGFIFIHHTLRASHTTTRAVDEWTRFHLAVTTGCCGVLPTEETGLPDITVEHGRGTCLNGTECDRVTGKCKCE